MYYKVLSTSTYWSLFEALPAIECRNRLRRFKPIETDAQDAHLESAGFSDLAPHDRALRRALRHNGAVSSGAGQGVDARLALLWRHLRRSLAVGGLCLRRIKNRARTSARKPIP
jgi:hypothetical protein